MWQLLQLLIKFPTPPPTQITNGWNSPSLYVHVAIVQIRLILREETHQADLNRLLLLTALQVQQNFFKKHHLADILDSMNMAMGNVQ